MTSGVKKCNNASERHKTMVVTFETMETGKWYELDNNYTSNSLLIKFIDVTALPVHNLCSKEYKITYEDLFGNKHINTFSDLYKRAFKLVECPMPNIEVLNVGMYIKLTKNARKVIYRIDNILNNKIYLKRGADTKEFYVCHPSIVNWIEASESEIEMIKSKQIENHPFIGMSIHDHDDGQRGTIISMETTEHKRHFKATFVSLKDGRLKSITSDRFMVYAL